MAPDRGSSGSDSRSCCPTVSNSLDTSAERRGGSEYAAANDGDDEDSSHSQPLMGESSRGRSDTRRFLAERADEPQNFTARGVIVGLVIGVIICFSNMYFGLQTGWVSGMSMPSALIGFAFFKSVAKHLDFPFTPVENVLVQTVAGALGTMPLGCGFVGVLPALNYLLTPEENGPLRLGVWKLAVWSFGICLFGVVFAVPLRRQVIIREKLKFPSGTATALMIGVLHGDQETSGPAKREGCLENFRRRSQDLTRSSSAAGVSGGLIGVHRDEAAPSTYFEADQTNEEGLGLDRRSNWKANIRLLIIAFVVSAVYVSVLSGLHLGLFAGAKPTLLDPYILLYPASAKAPSVRILPGQ